MNWILPETKEAFVAIKVSGRLDKNDYDTIVPTLKNRIEQYEYISLYWEMENFDGWTFGGLWTDLKFDVKYAKNFKKIAIVGEKKTHDLMESFLKPFTSSKTKYFDRDDKEVALHWAKSPISSKLS
ncbi:STAS/SEC14 domain-containing protein [Pelagicoccus sp. SDUM812002]|uniref:STAS/SEC14 domain-containing protein n=1 Tax=Pelagicoccus sp. SDUM812002 TaxID=3041266 RepID=UPI00280EDB7E|nr:STAS/SEC14 domain-containing protein [Pelagicoccus sp. SDUM812002]MDQ8184100.1 STAS/SEC14 domain-containing protein [Pelagicoccus sp. SDUM812002]